MAAVAPWTSPDVAFPGSTSARADAERVASYLVDRLAQRAGARFRQGARKPPLSRRALGDAVDLIATTRLLELKEPVARAVVAWAEGERRVHLLFAVPTPAELLAWQARGERCVSLLPEGASTAPHEDGLAFAMHDLCHLEKFVEPEHHVGQVGFFAMVHAATGRAGWNDFLARFDEELVREVEHVIADMNGSAVFLFAALKMKLKMAVRRKRARDLHLPPAVDTGPLTAPEEAAYAGELATLLDLLGIEGEAREPFTRVRTRRDDRDAALCVLGHFEELGAPRALVR